jgi:hypothetical protein
MSLVSGMCKGPCSFAINMIMLDIIIPNLSLFDAKMQLVFLCVDPKLFKMLCDFVIETKELRAVCKVTKGVEAMWSPITLDRK